MKLGGLAGGARSLEREGRHLGKMQVLGVDVAWRGEVALQEEDEGGRGRRVVRRREDDLGGPRAAEGAPGLCAAGRGAGRGWDRLWGIAPVCIAAGEVHCLGGVGLGGDGQACLLALATGEHEVHANKGARGNV